MSELHATIAGLLYRSGMSAWDSEQIGDALGDAINGIEAKYAPRIVNLELEIVELRDELRTLSARLLHEERRS